MLVQRELNGHLRLKYILRSTCYMMSSVQMGFKMCFIRVSHTFKRLFFFVCFFYSDFFSLCSYCHCSYSEADLIKGGEKKIMKGQGKINGRYSVVRKDNCVCNWKFYSSLFFRIVSTNLQVKDLRNRVLNFFNRKFRRAAFAWNRIFCNLINVWTVNKLTHFWTFEMNNSHIFKETIIQTIVQMGLHYHYPKWPKRKRNCHFRG